MALPAPVVEYFDVGGLEGIYLRFDVELDKLPLVSRSFYPPIPEEYMDRLGKLLGDAHATVTVGIDFKESDYGNAAGASCFVRLTCDQSEASVEETRKIAQEIAEKASRSAQQRARRLLDQALGREEKVVETPVSAEVDPEPRSQAAQSPVPGKTKIKVNRPGQPKFDR